MSAFCPCIAETFDVVLALGSEKREGGEAGLEVEKRVQGDDEEK